MQKKERKGKEGRYALLAYGAYDVISFAVITKTSLVTSWIEEAIMFLNSFAVCSSWEILE